MNYILAFFVFYALSCQNRGESTAQRVLETTQEKCYNDVTMVSKGMQYR